MAYQAKVILKSVGPNGIPITTFLITHPRIIHADFMTHRLFSRNASSSRAIPIKKVLDWVTKDTFYPVHWGSKKKGMQAGEEIKLKWLAKFLWWSLSRITLTYVKLFDLIGLHKQLANRPTEWFGWINVVVTATNFDNFYNLRCHEAAQPEIQKLAVMMARADREAPVQVLKEGEWHLPFISDEDKSKYDIDTLIKISGARCASTSYLTVDGKEMTPERACRIHKDLVESEPLHATPFEHQAQADENIPFGSNLTGWNQYRKRLKKERCDNFDYSILDTKYKDRDFMV